MVAGPSHLQKHSSSPTPSPTPPVISLKEFSELGNFIEVDRNSKIWKVLSLYATNSIGIETLNKPWVKVHGIYQLQKEPPKPSMFARLGFNKKSDGFTMLLWCKTTQDSIRRLANFSISCMAFYDRLARALPTPIESIKESLRIKMLLCKVYTILLLMF
jgi:hypothetical protein